MPAEPLYTAQLQAGLGMPAETLALLRYWEPGETPSRLAEKATSMGLFSRTTARRSRNIVAEMFAPRFLCDGGGAALRLKSLVEQGTSNDVLLQLFFLYAARAQAILHDFVTEVYWARYRAGATVVTKSDAERFIGHALDTGRMQKRWAASTVRRVSGYLLGVCADFGLVAADGRTARAIQSFAIRPEVTLYLAYDLHLAGLSDSAVSRHRDWQLFGLETEDVVRCLQLVSREGHILVQTGADLLQVSWKYRTMEECLSAIAQG